MTFMTRNPLNDFRTLQARMLEPFFGRFNYLDGTVTNGTWAPAVDVAEEVDRILVKVEVPGMEEKDLKVSFEDGLLTVGGERQFERRDDRSYHRIEQEVRSLGEKIAGQLNVGAIYSIGSTYMPVTTVAVTSSSQRCASALLAKCLACSLPSASR